MLLFIIKLASARLISGRLETHDTSQMLAQGAASSLVHFYAHYTRLQYHTLIRLDYQHIQMLLDVLNRNQYDNFLRRAQ